VLRVTKCLFGDIFSPSATKVAHSLTTQKMKEKVQSTTLIYRCYLDFNPQPQNRVFNTYELLKPSDLHPLGGF
jgi:hypothetical protein